jgi:hypothetical protein
MTKPIPNPRMSRRKAPPRAGTMHMEAAGQPASGTLRFGSVTLEVAPQGNAQRAENVQSGQEALRRITDGFVANGFAIRTPAAAPLYHADPANPDRLIRVWDGRQETGIFEHGVFKVTG